MQAALRQEFEKAYSSRVLTLQKFYEEKHSSLQQTLQDSYIKVLDSELLRTMVQDENTLVYVKDMIGELFEKVVAEERELVIDDLGMAIARIKGEFEEKVRRLSGENERLAGMLNAKEDELNKTKINYENRNTRLLSQEEVLKEQLQKTLYNKDMEIKELREELRGMNEELNGLRVNYTERDVRLKSVEKSQREWVENSKEFNNAKKEMELEIRSLELEIQRMNKETSSQDELRTGVIRMLENKLKEVEANSRDAQQSLRQQHNQKSLAYKKKIQDQKARVTQVLSKHSITEKKLEYSNRNILELQNKLTSLLQQNQRSISQYKSQRDRERIQLQKKFQYQLKEFQSHYQRLLQSKIQDVEEQALHHLNSMKECQYQYQQLLDKKAEEYDNNYVSRREHQRILKEKQEVIERQMMDLHDKELDGRELEFKITMEVDKKYQLQREIEHLRGKMGEYENVFREEKGRRKGLESERDSLKGENKKYKKLVSESEERMKGIVKDVEGKMESMEKLKVRNESIEKELRVLSESLGEKSLRVTQLEEQSERDKESLQEIKSVCESLKEEKKGLLSQNNYFQGKVTELSLSINAISQEQIEKEERFKEQDSLVKNLLLQKTDLLNVIENLKRSQDEQTQTIKLSMNQMTQKYTDFKSVASKLQVDLTTKDQLIAQLTSSNEQISKRKKRLQEMVVRLFKEVNHLSKCVVGMKEALVSSSKFYSKEMELLMFNLHSKIEETIKEKQSQFSAEKGEIKECFLGELNALIEKNKENHLQIAKESEARGDLWKSEVMGLNKLISQLKNQCLGLRQELSASKLSFGKSLDTAHNKIFNVQGQYQILCKQYETLKNSYKSLITQHDQLELSHKLSSKTLLQKQETLKLSQSELTLIAKQLEETVNINDLLKEKNSRLEGEINQMRSIVNKAAKGTECQGVKMAKILDIETKELTKRVEMLKKMGVSGYSGTKNMLRG